jgi:hypothetical protein
LKDPITFTLEGDPQPYILKFDFNEVCNAEAAAGCNLMQALSGVPITAAQTRGLLYACLKPANPQVLLSEAGALLSKDMPTVLRYLMEALGTADEPETTPTSDTASAAETESTKE